MVLDLSDCKCRISRAFVQQKLEELSASSDSIEEVVFGKNYFVGESAFRGFSHLKTAQNIRFASSIGQSAFEDCTALEDIDLRYNAEIPKRAFAGCVSLQKVIFAPHVIVCQEAFEECKQLKVLKNVEHMSVRWKSSFRECSSAAYDALKKAKAKVYGTEEDCIDEYLSTSCGYDKAHEIRKLCFGAVSAYKAFCVEVRKYAVVTVYRGPDKCYYYMLLEWISQLRKMYPAEKLDLHVVLGQDDYQELMEETAVRNVFSVSYDNVFFHINSDAAYLGNNNIFNVFAVDWSGYSSVLYCDVDVVFNKQLDGLFSAESSEWLVCVPNDPPFKKENTLQYYQQFIPPEHADKFQVFSKQPMFNGGMFMFKTSSLPEIRERIEECRDFILDVQHEHRNQHILNWVFLGHTQFIDSKYNNLYKMGKFNIDPADAVINHYTTTGTEILYSKILNKMYAGLQSPSLLAEAEPVEEVKPKNKVLASNFDFSSSYLQFDFTVTFDGENPKTGQRIVYDNEVFTFRVEFSQSLSYSAADVKKFIGAYLKHTVFIDQFDEVVIDLECNNETVQQSSSSEQKIFLFNSGGCDSFAVNELLSSQLGDDLVNLFILYDDQKTKDKHFSVLRAMEQVERNGQKMFVFYIKKSVSSRDVVLFEQDNLKSLRFLMSNTFQGAVYVTGDVHAAAYGTGMCTGESSNILEPLFMQSELLGLYVLLKRGFDLYYPVIVNSAAKRVNKLVLLKYLLRTRSDVQCSCIELLQKSVLCRTPKLDDKILKQLRHSIEGGYVDMLAEYKQELSELYPEDSSKFSMVDPRDSHLIDVFESVYNGDLLSVNKRIWSECFGKLKCKKLEDAFLESFKQIGVVLK